MNALASVDSKFPTPMRRSDSCQLSKNRLRMSGEIAATLRELSRAGLLPSRGQTGSNPLGTKAVVL
jgi:hypothetical protein